MPRIPIYEERQAVSQQMRVGQLSVPSTGAAAIGRGVQELGQAVSTAAGVMIRVEEENAKVWADNESSKASLQWTEDFMARQQNAKPGAEGFFDSVRDDFDKWADQKMKESGQSPIAQRMLASNLRTLRQNLLGRSLEFQAAQGRANRIATLDNSVLQSAQVIALDPSEMTLGREMGQREAAIDAAALTPSEREERKAKMRTLFGRAGAEAMARENPSVLLAQVDAAKKRKDGKSSGNAFLDLLEPTEWDTYINLAQNNTDAMNVESTANSVWNTMGPRSDAEPVNKDLMFAKIDEEMADRTPAERKAAKALIDSKAAAFDYSSNQRMSASRGTIWNMVMAGRSLDSIQTTPEWKILDGSVKVQLISQINDFRKPKPDSVLAAINYNRLMENPQRLAAMTDLEIAAMAPQLGQTYTANLLAKNRELNNPGAVEAATIDNDLFKSIADRAGFKPYATRQSDDEKATLGRLRAAVEAEISIEQQTLKRKLNNDEKTKVMQRVLDNKVMVDRFGRDKEMPIAIVEQDKLGATYVVVNGQEVYTSSIPAASRSKIIRQLRAAGVPVTEQRIAQEYILFQQQPSRSLIERIPQ